MTEPAQPNALSHLGAMLAEVSSRPAGDQEWSFRPNTTLVWRGHREVHLDALVAPFGQQAGQAGAGISKVVEELRSEVSDPAREHLRRDGAAALAELAGHLSWLQTARLAEALAQAAEEDAGRGDPRAIWSLPLVRRARFLTLSMPARSESARAALDPGAPFGDKGAEWTERARNARKDWLVDLVNHEEYPALTGWPEAQLDKEVRRLLFTGDDGRGSPLDLQVDATNGDDNSDLAAWISREWFLPRFMLADCWRALRHGGRWCQAAAVAAYVPLALLTAGVLFGLVITLPRVVVVPSAVVASLVAFVIIVAAIGRRRDLGYLACPRLPASAAVGLLALLSVDYHWVETPGGRWRGATLLLVLASYGYLVIEAASHGASGAAWHRALLVAVLGFLHGVAVAVLFLQVIAPALNVPLGTRISTLPAPGLSRLYLLAGATGLAAGVFLQVLWDDRPVTYPLTHLRWRGRGRP